MMRDKLSKREDRALHRALASIVLTQYPNPQRKDCPGTPVLRAIAAKSISMRDPAHKHVGSCSPCFAELTEIREDLHRRHVLWTMGTVAAAGIILAVLLTYLSVGRVDREADHRGRPDESRGVVQPGGTTPSQPKYEIALLDLRNASATRAVEGSNVPEQPIAIPRGLLALTIQLPIGSEVGSYEVEIRKANQPAIRNAKGQATIRDGITKLLINVDTNSIQPGEYEFGWRPVDFDWRRYPILIR